MHSDRWIDPEIRALLDTLPPLFGELGDETLPAVRRQQAAALSPTGLSAEIEREDHAVPGEGGAPDVVVRVHRPVGLTRPAPCVYWIHGGGYVMGSYRADDLRLQRMCLALGCVATSVEYRLAPETPFPGPLEDCERGLRWVHDHAGALGIDAGRIGVGGASAGGGLAAALALRVRELGDVPLSFQLLMYPMIDDRAATPSSGWDVPIWGPAANRYGWRSYLGALHGSTAVPATAAPARAPELSGLPPAFVAVGSADLFLDEDLAYARALIDAGVPTELHVYPGAVHGFESVTPRAALAYRARRDVADWLGRVMFPAR